MDVFLAVKQLYVYVSAACMSIKCPPWSGSTCQTLSGACMRKYLSLNDNARMIDSHTASAASHSALLS